MAFSKSLPYTSPAMSYLYFSTMHIFSTHVFSSHKNVSRTHISEIFPTIICTHLLKTFHTYKHTRTYLCAGSSDRPNVQFGRTSSVRFGPSDRTFFCRTQNFFSLLYIAVFKIATLDILSLAYVNNVIISVLTR